METENEVIDQGVENTEVSGESVEQVSGDSKAKTEAITPDAKAAGFAASAAEPKTMLEAIGKGLAKNADPEEKKVVEKAAKPVAKPVAKVDDPDILKMPEGLKPDSQARFAKLVETNKQVTQQKLEAEARAKEADETLGGFRQTLKETGTSPEDLDQFFGYKEKLTKGDLQGAMQVLQGQMKALSLAMGKPVDHAVVNPLSDYPDLAQEVEFGTISEERAMELAKSRKATADANARSQLQLREQQSGQLAQQAREGAIQSVEQWAAQMKGSDIDYAQKEATILAKLPEIAKTYPPNLWLTRIKEEYAGIVKPVAAREQNPLLRSGGGNPGASAPKTTFDAIFDENGRVRRAG